jgi:acyl dehydratase
VRTLIAAGHGRRLREGEPDAKPFERATTLIAAGHGRRLREGEPDVKPFEKATTLIAAGHGRAKARVPVPCTKDTPMLSQGATFEEHHIGATYTTLARTVSETDIVTFVNLCGFTEPLFMDMEYVARESVFGRRAAPGALTFALSEGLIMQLGLIHGTGMAFLGGDLRVVAPVFEGDTIHVEVEVTQKRESKKPDRGIVTYRHRILNQRDEVVLEAEIRRMIRRAAAHGTH